MGYITKPTNQGTDKAILGVGYCFTAEKVPLKIDVFHKNTCYLSEYWKSHTCFPPNGGDLFYAKDNWFVCHKMHLLLLFLRLFGLFTTFTFQKAIAHS